MKIPIYKKDGIAIKHTKGKYTHYFRINEKIITTDARGLRDGQTNEFVEIQVTLSNMCELSLEEFYIFKEYYKSIEELFILWLRRPKETEDEKKEHWLNREELERLLKWEALEPEDIEELVSRYTRIELNLGV